MYKRMLAVAMTMAINCITALTANATTSTVTFDSDTSWSSYTQDPVSNPGSLVGPAQYVCLKAAAPSYRWDATAQRYIFNFSTKGLTAGEYRIWANLDDESHHYVDICLI